MRKGVIVAISIAAVAVILLVAMTRSVQPGSLWLASSVL
jgi:hypothetical protein